MFLVVGLGNPGKKYERTRHNMGFLVIEALAKELGAEFKNKTLPMKHRERNEEICGARNANPFSRFHLLSG